MREKTTSIVEERGEEWRTTASTFIHFLTSLSKEEPYIHFLKIPLVIDNITIISSNS